MLGHRGLAQGIPEDEPATAVIAGRLLWQAAVSVAYVKCAAPCADFVGDNVGDVTGIGAPV